MVIVLLLLVQIIKLRVQTAVQQHIILVIQITQLVPEIVPLHIILVVLIKQTV